MSDNEVPAPACTLLWAALLLTPAAGETQNGESHYWKKKVLFILESKVLTSWMWILLDFLLISSRVFSYTKQCLTLTHDIVGIPWNLFLNLWKIIIAEIKHWCKLDLPFLRQWIKLNLLFLRLTSWSGFFYTSPLFKFQSDFWSEIKCCTIRCIK